MKNMDHNKMNFELLKKTNDVKCKWAVQEIERLRTELETKTKLMDVSIEYLKQENDKELKDRDKVIAELRKRLEASDRAVRLAVQSGDKQPDVAWLFPGMTFTKGG